MRFSQRIGLKPLEKIIQKDSIDIELRNGLWNVLTLTYWNNYKASSNSGLYGVGRTDYIKHSNFENLITQIWANYFKKPIDTIDEYWEFCYEKLRKYFFSCEWWEVYEFIEFISEFGKESTRSAFVTGCNVHLERENSAYRFVDGKIVEITSDEEILSIEQAIEASTPFGGVKQHLKRAVTLLSDKKNPDFRNSIKESISAVESLAKNVADDEKATLGVVLKKLEKSGRLHPALKSAFSSLYGYTNDADGIRHALLEEENLTKADAKFMLVCCSTFVNYVIETTT